MTTSISKSSSTESMEYNFNDDDDDDPNNHHHILPKSSSIESTNNIDYNDPNALPHSPVPLRRDEVENAEVRALAAKLAPALEEADALLRTSVPAEFQRQELSMDNDYSSDYNDYDDDNIDKEVEALHLSEQLLRQELELATDFSNLFKSPKRQQGGSSNSSSPEKQDNDVLERSESSHHLPEPVQEQQQEQASPCNREADVDEQEEKEVPEQHHLAPIRIPPTPKKEEASTPTTITPTATPSPSSGGPAAGEQMILVPASLQHPQPYTIADHCQHVQLALDEPLRSGWSYSVNLTRHVVANVSTSTSNTTTSNDNNNNSVGNNHHHSVAMREYCLAVPDDKLKNLFVGLVVLSDDMATAAKQQQQQQSATVLPPLAVRTIAIRIRPDVLCGAVMDAVHHALGLRRRYRRQSARIRKRQGGHLRAVVVGRSNRRRSSSSFNNQEEAARDASQSQPLPPPTPSFQIEASLCTYKSQDCERTLLLRIYHWTVEENGSEDEDEDDNTTDAAAAGGGGIMPNEQVSWSDAAHGTSDTVYDSSLPVVDGDDTSMDDDDVYSATASSNHVREACALLQRMESSPKAAKRIRPLSTTSSSSSPSRTSNNAFTSRQAMQEAVSEHFLQSYRACPSAKQGGITLPSLNSHDFAVMEASWPLIRAIWEELETRDLTYTTLETSRFGAFPALPTLDVHYCSQIRRLSREGMIVQLLKSASELEEYAREAEYACANLVSLLAPTFETYGMDAPSLPKATPLTAYPLDFCAPQQSCPPWGQKVMEALNEVQAWTGDAAKDEDGTAIVQLSLPPEDAKKSVAMAGKAVQLVLTAFQKQDDEEKGARLGRKNVQVMDRLAKMQEHQRASILALHQAHSVSEQAAKAADDFEAKSGDTREVPLLKWSIVVGGSTGTCLVTANHILFVTQLIPVFGGSKTFLRNIREVEFHVQEGTPSLLNPLPTVISVTQGGEEVYSFRPSMGGARLKSFLDIVRTTTMENLEDFAPGSGGGEV